MVPSLLDTGIDKKLSDLKALDIDITEIEIQLQKSLHKSVHFFRMILESEATGDCVVRVTSVSSTR